MNRRIITRYNEGILSAVYEENRFTRFDWEKNGEDSLIGNIYVGRVNKVVPGIQAAFVDVGNGLTGYYSLTDNRSHIYLSEGQHDRLKEGDILLVQVERDPVKTKMMVLTGKINLTGRYVALTCGYPGLSFSSKLKSSQYKAFKDDVKEVLSSLPTDEIALIVRTNAKETTADEIKQEADTLLDCLMKIRREAKFRTAGSLILSVPPAWLQEIRDSRDDELDEIVTDDNILHEQLIAYVETFCPTLIGRIRYYNDDYPLAKLYSIETEIDRALSERVWLKSGGFLIIQPTEAMTVIDVNTGKFIGKKNAEETFLKLNLEAAREIALQIKLRNLSGIIIVDFIDMETEESRVELMRQLEMMLSADQIKTTLVDMTKLGLVEITRKKVRKPLAEQFK